MTVGGRLVASLATLAFAILALFSGLDRLSTQELRAATLVPSALKSVSWRAQTARAIAEGKVPEAKSLAAAALASDPFDPRGASLFSASLLAAGQQDEATRAFAAVDELGFRAPLAQAYAFEAALAEGRVADAARRLDILLLAHPEMVREAYFFGAMEASEGGRRELAVRLMRNPVWAEAYLAALGGDNETLLARAEFLSREDNAVLLGCSRIDPMLRELARRDLRAQAQRLAIRQCPDRAAAQAVADSSFDQVGVDEAFGWRRHGSGNLRITVGGDRDKHVELYNRSMVTQLALSQPVMLAKGEYRLFASIAGQDANSVIASIDCSGPSRPSRESGSLGRGQLISAPNCADQILSIWIRPGAGPVRLDDLRVETVGPMELPGQSASSTE